MSSPEALAKARAARLGSPMHAPLGYGDRGLVCLGAGLCDECLAAALDSFAAERVTAAVAQEREACAVVAENIRGGFTANIRVSPKEQELVRDPDGPWVLNHTVANAIRARSGQEGR